MHRGQRGQHRRTRRFGRSPAASCLAAAATLTALASPAYASKAQPAPGDHIHRRTLTLTHRLVAPPGPTRPPLPVDPTPTKVEVLTAGGAELDDTPGGTADASPSSEPRLRQRLFRVMSAPGRARERRRAERRRARQERRQEAPGETTEETDPEPVPEEASATGSVSEVVYAAADAFGVDSAYLLSIAECESGLDPGAVNPAGYYGLFQFDEETWAAYGDGSIFDPAAQARAAAELIAAGESGRWPNCA